MLIQLSRAAGPAVPLDQVLRHLRVEGAEYEAEVEPCLAAAQAFVEARTTRILSASEWEYRTTGWSRAMVPLPLWPVREVTEVAYLDRDGAEQVRDPATWWWHPTASGALVEWNGGGPALSPRPQNVRIRFQAGCTPPDATGAGDDPRLDLPPQATHAVLLLTAHWFERRTPVSVAQGVTVHDLPFALQAILEQLRIFR